MQELISYRLNIEETRQYIRADSLAFLPLEDLHGMLGEEAPTFCDACLSGTYPVPPTNVEVAPKMLTGGRLLDEAHREADAGEVQKGAANVPIPV